MNDVKLSYFFFVFNSSLVGNVLAFAFSLLQDVTVGFIWIIHFKNYITENCATHNYYIF